MYLTSFTAASILSLFATSVFAAVPPYIASGSLTGFDNDTFVHVTGADNCKLDYVEISRTELNISPDCMIMPRDAFSNIGDAQRPGGSKSYCTSKGRFDDVQGRIHANFWSHVEFKNGTGDSGGRQVQLTGCIQPEALDRLNPDDVGEAYTSTGPTGRGNPRGSKCLGCPDLNTTWRLSSPEPNVDAFGAVILKTIAMDLILDSRTPKTAPNTFQAIILAVLKSILLVRNNTDIA
ncbi:putative effector protein [Ceratobasidium theobromae]|uniref:Putative effector protein n=1 Tax=Ceratobasidium theobromae TaxID=1582974 RepID=A0A5N5QD15_9AGAM|nr:putative effector protein [Ceratobasidium theobromae]